MGPDLEKLLKPHQLEALQKLRSGNILWGGVGTGKSRVALAFYELHERPKNIIVITTAKKRDSLDWETEAAKFAIGKTKELTVAGVLTVDSWNNIDKYSLYQGCFFIFDEQRLVGNGTWVKAFLAISKKNDWLLLSATPGDTWLDYLPVFLANGFYKNRTQFKREHVVYAPYSKFPKVERYIGTQKLERFREKILVHMPYMKETVRYEKTIFVEFDDVLYREVVKSRWNVFEDKPCRDVSELFMVLRRIVNSNESRLRVLEAILSEFQKVIVFYTFNYELELLRGLDELTAVSEWNGHKHESIPLTDSWLYLVQYAAGSEAWECTETNCMVFYSLTYSYKQWEQAHGRIDRINSPYNKLFYYLFKSRSSVDQAIHRSLLSKHNFNVSYFDEKNL